MAQPSLLPRPLTMKDFTEDHTSLKHRKNFLKNLQKKKQERAADESNVRRRRVVPTEARVEGAYDRPRRVIEDLFRSPDECDHPGEDQRDAEDLMRRAEVASWVENALSEWLIEQLDDGQAWIGQPALSHVFLVHPVRGADTDLTEH